MSRMTEEQYETEQAKLFKDSNIPIELHDALSYMAYEQGHAYGYGECLIHLRDYIDALSQPIKNFEKRVRAEAYDRNLLRQILNSLDFPPIIY